MPKNIKTPKKRSFATRGHLAFSFPQLNREAEWEEKCLVKSIQERIHSSPTEGNQSVESRLQLQWHQHDSGQFSHRDPRHGAGETCLRHFSGLTESPWECLTLAGRPGDRVCGWWSWWSTTRSVSLWENISNEENIWIHYKYNTTRRRGRTTTVRTDYDIALLRIDYPVIDEESGEKTFLKGSVK